MTHFVYILSNKKNGTIYVGMTSDLVKRIHQHKEGYLEGFTKKYSIHTLVYFECTDDRESALLREKNIKTWKRSWKLKLIEKDNPNWNDLYENLLLTE